MNIARTGIYRAPEGYQVSVLGRGHHGNEDVVVYQVLDDAGIEGNELVVHDLDDFDERFALVQASQPSGAPLRGRKKVKK